MQYVRLLWLGLVLLSGCSDRERAAPDGGSPGGDSGPGDDGGSPADGLRIDPPDAEVSVIGGVPATLEYRAFVATPGGREIEVTAEAMFWLADSALGSFSGRTFTSATDRGGHTRVFAMARGVMGSTGLTVRGSRVIIGPGAPADAPERFGGAEDPSRGPSLVYPPDGILVPPNLNVIEVHYMPNGNSLFELHVRGSALDLRVYFACETLGAGCVYEPSEEVWSLLSDAERGRDPVTYRIRGVDAAGGPVGVSAEQTIGFAEEDITGGLYYWNAGAGAILRYDFGLRGAAPERYMDAPRAGATTCVGCHVLSRNGSRIAIGMDIPAPSPYKVYEVGTRDERYQQGSMFGGGGANFFSFSPDASQIMTSNGATISLRNAETGAAIRDPLVSNGAMPDWSPDGMRMVYARPATPLPCFGFFCGAPGVDSASLQTMVLSGDTWSDGPELVAFGGQNSYYPTFSPDGNWVLFNRSPSNQNSFDAPDAQVWVVPADGGEAVHLATASTGGDSWPKWDPTVYMHRSRPLMWFTFSSRRAYGLRLAAGTQAQLWMTAFDPSRGADPSYPAFWMPFQEIESGNHIAQWVTSVDRQPCSDDAQCAGGEFCSEGFCLPDLI